MLTIAHRPVLKIAAAAASAVATYALGAALYQEIRCAHTIRKHRDESASFYEHWADSCAADASSCRTHGEPEAAARYEADAHNLRLAAAMLRSGASRTEVQPLLPPPF